MRLRPLLIGICVVLVVWSAAWLLTSGMIRDPAERGHFGDQFGALNALFSGLAFAVILAALLAQREATTSQREQFEREIRDASMSAQKQVEMSALAAYADLTRALWESNRDRLMAAKTSQGKEEWQKAMEVRYREMMAVREVFEKVLKDGGILKQG